MTYHRSFITSNTTGTLVEKELLTPVPSTSVLSILGLRDIRAFQIFSLLCSAVDQMDVFFYPLFLSYHKRTHYPHHQRSISVFRDVRVFQSLVYCVVLCGPNGCFLLSPFHVVS